MKAAIPRVPPDGFKKSDNVQLSLTPIRRLQQRTFLVVDDDAMNLNALVMGFRKNGLRAEGVPKRDLFVQAVRNLKPDVVLLDYYFGGKSGIQMAMEYKKEMGNALLILMSAHSNIRILAEEYGIPYLEKPVSLSGVFTLLKYYDGSVRNPYADYVTHIYEGSRRSILYDIVALLFSEPQGN